MIFTEIERLVLTQIRIGNNMIERMNLKVQISKLYRTIDKLQEKNVIVKIAKGVYELHDDYKNTVFIDLNYTDVTNKREYIIQNYNLLKRSELAKRLKISKFQLNIMIMDMNLREEGYKQWDMKRAISELTSQAKQDS